MALPYDAESPEEAADWEADQNFLDGVDEDDTMDCGCSEGMHYCEPDLDWQFEFDSSMTSAGWGTEEDYGYYGDEF